MIEYTNDQIIELFKKNSTEWMGYYMPDHVKRVIPWFSDPLWDATPLKFHTTAIDRVNTHIHLECVTLRTDWGTWNGYVYIPQNHPLCKLDTDDDQLTELAVHGGITFSGDWGTTAKTNWVIGFDTNHTFDYSPTHNCYTKETFADARTRFKTRSFVVNELDNLTKDIFKKYRKYSYYKTTT